MLGRSLRPSFEACYSLVTRHRGVERILDGESFRIDSRVRYLLDHSREPELRSFLRDRLGPKEVLLDVGAHAGVYVMLFCRWSPRGMVHAFEPNPGSRHYLERNVRLNGFGSRVLVQESAVSDRDGRADFFALSREGMSRLGSENPALRGRTMRLTVPTTTLDQYCRVNAVHPTWIRMDIEGFEIAALRGAADIIRRGRGSLTIVVEMHPDAWADSGDDERSAQALLGDLGLRPVPLTGQRNPLAEYGIVHLAYR